MSQHIIPYPKGFWRIIARLPLYLQQAGLGWVLRLFPVIILTTQGRKSGLARHAVLEYRRHGSKLYLISAWGEQPQWYKNLVQQDSVTVQFKGQEWQAKASTVTDPGEAMRALYMFKRTSPLYEMILASMSSASTIDLRTLKAVSSEFTVVRLDLLDEKPTLEGVAVKNRWIAPIILGMTVLAMVWMVLARLSDSD
ncbi:MAG: nitroreductase family deazaflavin-dependent oxidoreductase [Anaerolineae bacterium]|nr:nitroreductase family deazaflavin-dependent oxidoreductase [Anaerolineae bacterium]